MHRIYAILLAAGRGSRFGEDKVTKVLGDRPVWRWSYDVLAESEFIQSVTVVHGEHNAEHFPGILKVRGGQSRAESVRAGFEALPDDATHVVIHDAARPFLTSNLLAALFDEIDNADGIAPAIPVTDTVRHATSLQVIDRTQLLAMQTPQLVNVTQYRTAIDHDDKQPNGANTDDLGELQSAGMTVKTIEGADDNFKITTAADWARAVTIAGTFLPSAAPTYPIPEFRTGIGYDVHRFSTDPNRPLWLGGVLFPDHVGLEGHSDADVVLHAVVDAILGAAALGDIGWHFPPTDPRWHNAPSIKFLDFAVDQVRQQGWKIVHLDIAVIAEVPKIMPRAGEIRAAIADSAAVTLDRVSIKATTNEGMGFVGRREGIACHAVATLSRLTPGSS
jgi:2-C-methyl-D-erythritol 4-phosphate cytidylyltransferase/2-C-methyl-D-erythritol 2,4-cyclodiphosphate synthase